jgi:hypothetical protein
MFAQQVIAEIEKIVQTIIHDFIPEVSENLASLDDVP